MIDIVFLKFMKRRVDIFIYRYRFKLYNNKKNASTIKRFLKSE